MAKLTYADKVNLSEKTSIPAINKITDDDMNEIKSVVNANDVVGIIQIWSTGTAPTGFLLCDGTAVSRTTYAALFAVIGTTYGVGDNSTTFNVPNLKGKVIVGVDATQTEFDTLAETGGAKTVTLDETMIPAHKHSIGGSDGSTISNKIETTAFGSDISSVNIMNTNNTGGGLAHNNLQPYMALNYIIKF